MNTNRTKMHSLVGAGFRFLLGAFAPLLAATSHGQTPSGTYPTSYGVYEATLYKPGITYAGFRLMDMNNDAAVEVLAARYNDGIVEVWECNRATGLLELRDSVFFGHVIHDVDAADFDHDGDVDIAVATAGHGLFVALNGAGPGASWGAPWIIQNIQARYGWQVGIADFNMDGHPDLFHGVDSGYVHVFRGIGDGTFAEAAAPTPVSGAGYRAGRGLTAIDVDANHRPDLIGLPSERFGDDYGYLRAHLNTGTAGMIAWSANIGPTAPIQTPPPHVNSTVNCAADMNRDGFVDQLFVMDSGHVGMMWGGSDVSGLTWTRQILANLAVSGLSAQLADVNDDGWMDFGVYSVGFSGLRIFVNDRAGGFAMESIPGPASIGYYWKSLAGGDVDGDGLNDLVASRNAGRGLLLYHRINQPPVADAGADQSLQLGASAQLDGSGSTDDQTALSDLVSAWTIETAPAGSAAALTGADSLNPVLVPDLAGDYTLKLTLTDSKGLQDTDETTVTASAVIGNGSFEDDFAGWVPSGNVSLQSGGMYTSTDGTKLVAFNAMNSPPNGVLSRSFTTVPGQAYRLEFDAGVLAYNRNQQRLGVTVVGGGQLMSDTITLTGLGGGMILWVAKSYLFTADSATSTVIFRDLSTTTDSLDLLLDHVRITSAVKALLVTSMPGVGVGVGVIPSDTLGAGDGITTFTRTYNPATVVQLSAPAEAGGGTFYQWWRNGAEFGTTASTQVTMDGDYQMTAVYWSGGPVITVQPAGTKAVFGGAAVFSVTASGAPPLSYQWRFNGTDIGGAVDPVLTIDPVEAGDAGNYDVVVSNSIGSVTSDPAALTVQSELLANPSFEFDYQGWTVSGVQGIRATLPYVASDGVKLVAFNVGNASANGVLSQSFPTTPGIDYLVSFDMGVLAYNTSEQRLQAELSGSPIFVSETYSMRGIGGGKVVWETKSIAFTADSATTTLTFRDRSPTSNSLDLLLDNVRVTPGIARTLVVESSPDSGVSVAVSPPDTSGAGDGVTGFSRSYNNVPEVSLTAPVTVNGYRFQKWLKNGVEIGTSPIIRVTMDLDYTLTAAYAVGPPVITVQPEDVVTGLGGGATFRVTAEGIGPLTYQWRFNGADITGAESDNYTVAGVRAEDVGAYDVVVSNAAGPTTSDSAALTLVPTSLVNSSFESDYQGWNYSGNLGIRITAPPYAASDGIKLVAFNAGNTKPNGILSQTFATTPGITYVLSFDMGVLAYNTAEQRLQVDLSGSPAFRSETYAMRGIGGGKTVWETKSLSFTADSTATTVTFKDVSLISDALDLLLDNIRLTVQPIVVTTLADEDDGALGLGSGDSLREAIAVASMNSGADVIHFAPALNGGTITLGGKQLTVDTDVTIDASSLSIGVTVSGNDVSRVFEITAGRTVAIAGLTITAGYVSEGDGAGILNAGILNLKDATVAGNEAESDPSWVSGGGIFNSGSLTMECATVSENRTTFRGLGCGIANTGSLTLINSSIVRNFGDDAVGGGVWNSGNLTLRHSTVSANSVLFPWGAAGVHNGGQFEMENSIVAGNLDWDFTLPNRPSDISGSVTSSRGANLIGGDPMLATLGNHGGRTQTMPPLPGSPAIDAAIWLGTSPATDQRGFPRIAGTAPDIGAVELPQLLVTTIADEDDASLGLGVGDSLREAIAAAAASSGVELIRFAAPLDGGSIILGGTQLNVDTDVMIDALNLPAGITVSGNDVSRVFEITAGRTVSMAGVSIVRGVGLPGPGGGISNSGTLVLKNVTVSDHWVPSGAGGGGIYNAGNLQMDSSTVSRSGASFLGTGGGIYNSGTATLVNSTISENSASSPGGGISNTGTLTLRHTTVTDNNISTGAGPGGGISNDGTLTLENSIIAGNWYQNSVPSDISGTITESLGVNLIVGDPMLAPLGNHGGRTETMPPLPGSPAIDAAVWLPTNPALDQQGNPRPEDFPDIGAVEASEFSLIPAGAFQMGDAFGEGNSSELPVHEVSVSAFYMAKYEVTKALWDRVRSWGVAYGYPDLPAGGGAAADHPVRTINWYDMVKWCNARSEREGLTPCYTVMGEVYRTGPGTDLVCNWAANGYRLPTEAEWEKAARGGLSGKRFPWGDTITHNEANYHSESQFSYDVSPTRGYHPAYGADTAPVGTFPANGYGLHEMTGNIWEWCWDRWSETYYASSPSADPHGSETGSDRVVRSGGFFSDANGCRVAFRYGAIPAASDGFNGFRLARSVP